MLLQHVFVKTVLLTYRDRSEHSRDFATNNLKRL